MKESSIRGIDVEIIKLILETFLDVDIIHNKNYYELMNLNNRDVLQYMFNNFNHNYVKNLFCHLSNNVEEEIFNILLDDIIKKI